MGLNATDKDFMKIKISEGRMFKDDDKELILSKKELKILNKNINDNIPIANETYKVVGVTDNSGHDAYTSLRNTQKISSNDKLNIIMLKVKPSENATKISEEIQEKYGDEEDITVQLQENIVNMAKLMYIISTVIPTLIAIILILNSMLKSVNDRKREIGLLKAIGWKTRRIFALIISETFILSICSFIIGSVISILSYFLMETTWLQPNSKLDFITFIESLNLNTFPMVFGLIILVALIAGLLPAIRASRLSPTEALREE
ncbi:MAG: FtsX-like permease family protein [Methanobrevibacter sp.]|nr:FtsX-like permease family protein [Candidatus Methanovirga aequatorialis]